MSSTVLSLLVALVSVLSVGLPPIIKLLQPKELDITFTIVETELPDTITTFVSNIGGGFGAVGKLEIYGPTNSEKYKSGKVKAQRFTGNTSCTGWRTCGYRTGQS